MAFRNFSCPGSFSSSMTDRYHLLQMLITLLGMMPMSLHSFETWFGQVLRYRNQQHQSTMGQILELECTAANLPQTSLAQ